MGCAESRVRTRVSVRDVEGMAQTGDLILFSSKHAGAKVTKFFTGSTWDHIGMVVKFPSAGGNQAYILEYAGGVFLYPLFTRLYTYYAIQGRMIALRRLLPSGCRDELQQDLQQFVRSLLGQKPPSISEMVVAVLKQETVLSGFISKLRGSSESETASDPDDLSSIFCSKLIAVVYKHAGLIAPSRASSDFLPKHFSQAYDGYIDLQGGALLGPELPIDFESVQDDIEHIRALVKERSRKRPEEMLHAASQFWLGIGDNIGKTFENIEKGLHGWSANAEVAMEVAKKHEEVEQLEGLETSSKNHPRPQSPNDEESRADSNNGPGETPTGGRNGNSVDSSGGGSTRGSGEPGTATSELCDGGMQVTSGEIVDELMQDDGGIYSHVGTEDERARMLTEAGYI